jgi:hypothetical protein
MWEGTRKSCDSIQTDPKNAPSSAPTKYYDVGDHKCGKDRDMYRDNGDVMTSATSLTGQTSSAVGAAPEDDYSQ